jgi:hypothetical protein
MLFQNLKDRGAIQFYFFIMNLANMIFLSPSVKCDNNARIDMIRAGGTKTFLLPFYSNNLDNTLIENVSKGD